MIDYLLKHYARTYENFDKCMACFEDLIIICQKQQNYEIAEPLGYWCQGNKDCPIRITFVETLDENFEVEWVLED